MANKGIGIIFNADSTAVRDESRKVQGELTDIQDTLQDVGHTSKDSGREQEQALERVKRATDDLGDEYVKSGEKADKSLEGVKGKTGDVTGGLRDLGGAAKDALSGDLSSAATTGLDALSGLAAAVPGIGALIGVVFAEVGKGLVGVWQQSAKESEDRIKAMYQDFAKSGTNYLSGEYVRSAADAILGDPAKYAEAQKLARDTGVALQTVIEGLAGGESARAELQSVIVEKIKEQTEATKLHRDANGFLVKDNDQLLKSLDDQLSKLREATGERNTAYDKGQLLYGIQQNITSEVEKSAKALADIPQTIATRLIVDDTELRNTIAKSQLVRVTVDAYTRNGAKII